MSVDARGDYLGDVGDLLAGEVEGRVVGVASDAGGGDGGLRGLAGGREEGKREGEKVRGVRTKTGAG